MKMYTLVYIKPYYEIKENVPIFDIGFLRNNRFLG